MKHVILTTIIILLGTFALRAESQLITQADSAYNADDFRQAADMYLNVIQQEGPSAKLYYNLGNTYYRLGEMGNAVIAYERALRLDPSDKDARNNLDFVNARITDRPGERGTFLGNALDAISAGILAYLFSEVVTVRKIGFFGGILTVIGCCACLFFSFRAASIASADNVAIVTVPSTILSTTPRVPQDRTQEAMLLHEGTKVTILDSVRSTTDSIHSLWYDVEVDNAHRAWINAAAVQKI